MPSIINATTTTGLVSSADNSGSLQLATNNGTTAVTIDTSQNVCVGTATALATASGRGNVTLNGSSGAILAFGTGGSLRSYIFQDSSTMYLNNSSNGSMNFDVNGAERMRITSDGLVGIGTSSPGSKLEVNDNSGNPTIVVRTQNASSFPIEGLQTSASYIGPGIRSRVTTKAVGGDYQAFSYYNDNAGAYRFLVAGNGNVQNTNGSYGTISDVKLKENIVDATSKLDKVNQLQVRNYNLIGDELKQIGFVAQEFEQVFPSMVEESADKDVDGNDLGTTTKTIKTTVLIPILVKAIQELKAELDATKAEVAALKGA